MRRTEAMRGVMSGRGACAGAAVIVMLCTRAAVGQEMAIVEQPDTAGDAIHSKPMPEGTPEKPLHLSITLDMNNAEFSRGIYQGDRGPNLEPGAILTYTLARKDEWELHSIFGTWNSIHSSTSGNAGQASPRYWHESDWFGGAGVTHRDLTIDATYVVMTSPSGAAETNQEVDVTVTYDDKNLLRSWRLHPHATLAIETAANPADDPTSDPGTYLELGIAPGFEWDVKSRRVEVSFPVTVGLSLHNYYQDATGSDELFGFAQVGAAVSIPLSESSDGGSWKFNAGVFGLFLGDHNAALNNGKHVQFLVTAGLQFEF